jgi:hypothetical protein
MNDVRSLWRVCPRARARAPCLLNMGDAAYSYLIASRIPPGQIIEQAGNLEVWKFS